MNNLLLFLSLAASTQIALISNPYDGYTLGDPTKSYNFTMDYFIDHLCKDTKASYPALMQYYNKHKDTLTIRIHVYPLPKHTYSYYVSMAGRLIQQTLPSQFLNFTQYFFNHQEIFLEDAYKWDTLTIFSKIAQYTSTGTSADYKSVLEALENYTFDFSLRVSRDYGAFNRITGTPRYFINDVWAYSATFITSEREWINYFNGLTPN